MLSMMVAMISGITFGGLGFLESKDQLWIIKSAPRGVWKFGKARVVQLLLLAILIVIIPAAIVGVLFQFGILETITIFGYTYWVTIGAVLISIGITANNPTYENQKSAAFMINTFASILLIMFILLVSLFSAFPLLGVLQSLPLVLLIAGSPMVLVGGLLYVIGITRMASVDSS